MYSVPSTIGIDFFVHFLVSLKQKDQDSVFLLYSVKCMPSQLFQCFIKEICINN